MSNNIEPLVYSCSGCSNVAQLANDVALELNARKIAQMSCIAGVGGKVKGLVKLAKSGRPIVALDGCKLHCVKACLAEVNVQPYIHLTFTDSGKKKGRYEISSNREVSDWCEQVLQLLERRA